MARAETSTRKIIQRLSSEGWVLEEGGSHKKFTHPNRPGILIVVPRHTETSVGVARSIAKAAGWIKKG